MSKPTKTISKRTLRRIIAGGVLGVLTIGLFLGSDGGTLCSWCPIGLGQVSLGAKELQPALILSLGVVVIAALLFGRAFCSWGCPTNVIKKLSPKRSTQLPKRNEQGASSFAIIAVVLLASLVVGFPIFCLFCPIGLIFGFIYAVFRSLTVYQPSWDLLIFPLMLVVEFRLLRSWCSRICPIGALFGLITRFSPVRRRPIVNTSVCRINEGCTTCTSTCPEHISRADIHVGADASCTLCLECQQQCPSHAIKTAFPLRNKKGKRLK